MKKDLLLQLAEIMGTLDLAQFCAEGDVSSESYGYSTADIEAEMAARCRYGARRFLEYVAKHGTLPPPTSSYLDGDRAVIESILLQGGE